MRCEKESSEGVENFQNILKVTNVSPHWDGPDSVGKKEPYLSLAFGWYFYPDLNTEGCWNTKRMSCLALAGFVID